MILWKRLYCERYIFRHLQRQQTHSTKIDFLTLKALSSVCAKSELASSKNNEILEINALQKFTPHALYAVEHQTQ